MRGKRAWRICLSSIGLVAALLSGACGADVGPSPFDCDPYECPGVDTPCRVRACVDNQCSFQMLKGPVEGLPVTEGDCIELRCDGQGNIIEVPDDLDFPTDDNECTDVVCSSGVASQTITPNKVCGDQNFGVRKCTAAGECVECDDENECTVEDCSTGIVKWQPAPAGTACGGPDSASECDGAGACVTCIDTVKGTPKSEGSACAVGGKSGTCDAKGECITFCQPLPDPATCPDNGPGEPNNGTQATAYSYGTITDDDDDGKRVCGVLKGADADWYMYTGTDAGITVVDPVYSGWSSDDIVRICMFVSCHEGDTSVGCAPGIGEENATSPGGHPGCCVEKAFASGSYYGPGYSFDCGGVADDVADVWLSVEWISGGSCVPYALSFHY